jgi:hypothetical protein
MYFDPVPRDTIIESTSMSAAASAASMRVIAASSIPAW